MINEINKNSLSSVYEALVLDGWLTNPVVTSVGSENENIWRVVIFFNSIIKTNLYSGDGRTMSDSADQIEIIRDTGGRKFYPKLCGDVRNKDEFIEKVLNQFN